jgi:hypothetical protein
VRALVVAALVAATMMAAGCGDQAPSPSEARATVVTFVRALAKGDGATACAIAMPDVVTRLRESAAGGYIPTAHDLDARLRQIRAAHAKARTCEGAVAVLRTTIAPAEYARLLARARTLPLEWPGPFRNYVLLGQEQDWGLVRDGHRWRVDITNALSDV